MTETRAEAELALILYEDAYSAAAAELAEDRTPESIAAFKESSAALAAARTAFRINFRDPEAGVGGTTIQPESVTATSVTDLER